jgi:hypothetical protein
MNIGNILKKAGSSLLRNAFPPISSIAFDLINDALPTGKKLSETATGEDAEKAIKSLPPEQRLSLMEKKLDVEIAEIKEWTNVVDALAEVDKTGNSTRPEIARDQSNLIGFGVVATLGSISYAIVTQDSKMIDSISSAWPLISAALGVPASIVISYFGKRAMDKSQKYQAVANVSPPAGTISQIIGMFKK